MTIIPVFCTYQGWEVKQKQFKQNKIFHQIISENVLWSDETIFEPF